jgi:hypothetical protein
MESTFESLYLYYYYYFPSINKYTIFTVPPSTEVKNSTVDDLFYDRSN